MLLWHVGATVALARYSFRDERMDLRFLTLGAVLPDLIDTPIGLAGFSSWQAVRLGAHSLTFAGVVMAAIVLATRRGRPRKRWMPVAIGVLIHLFLDAMWASPATLWWPILGWEFTTLEAMTTSEYMASVVRNAWTWAGEAIGLTYLGWLARAGRLDTAEARRELLQTGRIDVPIGR